MIQQDSLYYATAYKSCCLTATNLSEQKRKRGGVHRYASLH